MSNHMHTTKGDVTYMHTPQTVELDGAALKAEASKSHEFLTLVYYGANRERNREVTDIEQMRKAIELKQKESLDPERWLEAFKKLEDMDMGALIMGRRGNPNRFKWNYSLKAIGQAAVNGSNLTAHRIVARKKGEKIVNDYHSSRPSFVNVNVKRMDKTDAPSTTRKIEVPIKTTREAVPATRKPIPVPTPKNSRKSNFIYIALRPDYTFEAEIPTLTEKEAEILCAAIKRCV